jgi:hypothetical protein
MVLRRFAGFNRCEGERERDTRDVAVVGLWWEFAEDWRGFFDSFLITMGSGGHQGSEAGHILEEFLMQVRSTLFTIIVIIVELLLGFVSHAKSMLPSLARLALHHELASIRVILSLRKFSEPTERERGLGWRTRTCAPAYTARNPLLLVVWRICGEILAGDD